MNGTRATRIGAVLVAGIALAGVAAPAFATEASSQHVLPPAAATSNSGFRYSNNWLVNDSGQTVHVKAQVDVGSGLWREDSDNPERNIESKTVEKDLQPGESLRMAGGSGYDTLFEYHLFVDYRDGASADVAMYNPDCGRAWVRDGHVGDKSYVDEGESHTHDVGNGHTVEVDRHWNHVVGEDSTDDYFAFGNTSGNICNWDYHIR